MPLILGPQDYEYAARDLLDGKTYAWLSSGSGDEHTLRANRNAFAAWVFRPRVLVDVSAVNTETAILGTTISMPLLIAPMGLVKLAGRGGEVAVARAAAEARTIMCIATGSSTSLQEIRVEAPPAPRWFQLYVFRDPGLTEALAVQAAEAAYDALVLTVDAPVTAVRERAVRKGFSFPVGMRAACLDGFVDESLTSPDALAELVSPAATWKDLEALTGLTRLPVIVKGVLRADDARRAAENGAQAVIVSNHGGRQLDGARATLDALSEVVESVPDHVEVLLDGGIRRGTDVVKALALGARAVLIGRPVLWALAAEGESGVRKLLELFREEVALALALLGCPSPADVSPDLLTRTSSYH